MIVYHGIRLKDVPLVVKATEYGMTALPWALELRNHSPTGLEWGYGGSGPAQLALALLYDACRMAPLAEALHQQFKAEVVGQFPREGWSLSRARVLLWMLGKLGVGHPGLERFLDRHDPSYTDRDDDPDVCGA